MQTNPARAFFVMGINRTYKLSHFANKEKSKKVFEVLREYRKTCTDIASKQWRLFFNSEKLNKMADLRNVNSKLSERYKRNCAYQVDSSLKSYISNRQNDFVDKVYGSSLGKDIIIKMLQINRRELWFKTEHKLFTKEELWLARKIFKLVLSNNRKPNFHKCNMLLNENVAEIIIADKTKTVGFDYWIQFSTLEKRKPILIPVKSNKYFNGIEGKLCHATQFNFNGNNAFTVSLIKNIPKIEMKFNTEQISLDFGLKALFTNKDGKMFGKYFYNVLKKYDKLISELAKNLQKQKIKLKSSNHYNTLVSNLRDYIKNEINRVINRIIKLYNPKHIVVENLNFENVNLSKRLNRILKNCGRGVIDKKFESLKEVYRITFKLINAAYTSQECNKCHYVDKKNRKKQEIFKCLNCRHTINADVNASRVQDYRSSVPELANIYTHRKKLLHKLVTLFMERNTRLNSKAKDLIEKNPYFKDYIGKSKQVA